MRVEHVLVVVTYISWVPSSVADAKQGNLGKNEKTQFKFKCWAPYPIDDSTGAPSPDLMPLHDQGYMYALGQLLKFPPDGREVLAIVDIDIPVVDQQPVVASQIRNNSLVCSFGHADVGLKPGLPSPLSILTKP